MLVRVYEPQRPCDTCGTLIPEGKKRQFCDACRRDRERVAVSESDVGSGQARTRRMRDVVVARFRPTPDLRRRASALLRVLMAAEAIEAAERSADADTPKAGHSDG